MKKLSSSVSPFLLLVIPMFLFVGLSFTFNQDKFEHELSSSFPAKSFSTKMVSIGQQTLLNFLLKK